MQHRLKIAAVIGSFQRPSRTAALVEALLERFAERLPVDIDVIEISDIGKALGGAFSVSALPEAVRRQFAAVESADFLIVAAPVFRGTYPGLFKHFFDLVGQNALVDTPVLLAATGGSDRHALVIDHQLRPLFSFFQSLTLPIGVYGTETDFSDYRVSSPALQTRIDLAVERALPLLRARQTRVAAELLAA
ncbi:MsuE subfamily FMN reductase [Microvirgula sp. AG722]|uniref:FMN reductase n=1 Tax=Microvirgula aerodenitrificans TaxID=57480 RepID=A0A2S0P9Z6_9NEIS|nr:MULTISPECIES: FMN reductase [Microvirgula]AVY94224.1 FMN reductase [Microvirgula aerodenitrificans]RAS15505.1 MsuE subfamily FMN reductase [Microvirgula sp. AG722]